MSNAATPSIRFCARCGTANQRLVPPDDNRLRDVCPSCGHIHYENPRPVVGCLATWEGKILLCRRAIEPRLGYWTLPAGFMENGETAADGARRETREEAGAEVLIDAPLAMVSIAHIDQIHLFYRGHLPGPDYAAGVESLEVALVAPVDIPWGDIAFPSVSFALQCFLADQARGQHRFHEWSIPTREAALTPPPAD